MPATRRTCSGFEAVLAARPRVFPARGKSKRRRRGNIVVMSACLMVVMLVMIAFAVDLGCLTLAKTEAQRTADSAALAAAWRMVDESRLTGSADLVALAARDQAVRYAAACPVGQRAPVVNPNYANNPNEDVVLGRVSDPSNPGALVAYGSPETFNAVRVRVRFTESRNGLIPLFFARVVGLRGSSIAAEATAGFDDRVVGFRVTQDTGNASLLPFAVRESDWDAMMAGGGNDAWAYNPASKSVSAGSDGMRELKLYPNSQNPGGGIVPGNFGTLDLGPPINDAEILWRHILEGPNQDDLAYFGGEIKLGPDGTLPLGGDTGITTSMKDPLSKVVGRPRTIPIYREVAGTGDGAVFTIVRFVGVRIVTFKMTTNDKYILIQPALVVDPCAITGSGDNHGYGVVRPPILMQ